MILDYDRTLNISSEQRIESLMDSVQLALTNLETRVNSVSATVSSNSDNSSGNTQKITVDSVISSTSQNPVQNKVIYTALLDKAENSALTTTNNRVTALENADEEFQKGYDALVADNVVVKERITANEGKIGTLESDNVTIKDSLDANTASIKTLTATSATIEQLNTANASIKKLETEKVDTKELTTNYAHLTEGVIDNASIDFAKVNNVEITNAQIKDATITSAKIESINGEKITDGSIVAKALSSQVIETLSNTNVYYQATDPYFNAWNNMMQEYIQELMDADETLSYEDAEKQITDEQKNAWQESAKSQFKDDDIWYETLVEKEETTTDDGTTSTDEDIPQLDTYENVNAWGDINVYETDSDGNTIYYDDDGNITTSDKGVPKIISTYKGWYKLAEAQNRIVANSIIGQQIVSEAITVDHIDGKSISLEWLGQDVNDKINAWQDESLIHKKWASIDNGQLILGQTDSTETNAALMRLSPQKLEFVRVQNDDESTKEDAVAFIDASSDQSYMGIDVSRQSSVLLREHPSATESNNCNLGIIAQTNGHISLKEVLD